VTPLLLVLSSPSGGGKSTIAGRLLAARDDIGYSISATTRSPRPGEQDGREYHFLTPVAFEEKVAAGEFLEHAVYNGQRYGTLLDEVRRVTQGGRHALLDIEVAGARMVRERHPDAVLVFLLPPSGKVLVERLRARGTEDEAAVAGRLEQALEELSAAVEYDFVVVNNDLDEAVRKVGEILDVESHRISRLRNTRMLLDRLKAEVAAEIASGTTQAK
jgi:guanylate kinase